MKRIARMVLLSGMLAWPVITYDHVSADPLPVERNEAAAPASETRVLVQGMDAREIRGR